MQTHKITGYIHRFEGEYAFLGNFYRVEIEYEDLVFPSVENAYQASKTLLLPMRKLFANPNVSSGVAKRMGNKKNLRNIRLDWEDVKVSIMTELIDKKFSKEPLSRMLIGTGVKQLIEGRSRGDKFWGWDFTTACGENNLGKIIMAKREALIAEIFHSSRTEEEEVRSLLFGKENE